VVRKKMTNTKKLGFVLIFLLLIPSALAVLDSFQTDGMLVFADDSQGVIDQVNWSDADRNLSGQAAGTTITGENIRFLRLIKNHERDEALIAIRTTQDDIHTQTWNGTGWSADTLHATDSQNNDAIQSFDVAYEQASGSALLVYENTFNDNGANFSYKSWNGTHWSAETHFEHGYTSELNNMRLYPQPDTDNIMLLAVSEDDVDLFALLWNGSGWDNSTRRNLTTDLSCNDEECFDFAWEGTSQQGVAFYGVGSSGEIRQKEYSLASNNWAEDAAFFDVGGSGAVDIIKVCADRTSDYIGLIVQDASPDVEVGIWNGAALETSPARPAEGTDAEGVTAGTENVDCAWEHDGNKALFVYAKGGNNDDEDISFITYDKTAWSVADVDDSPQLDHAGITNSLEQTRLQPSLNRNEIMFVGVHANNDPYALVWNASTTTNWTVIEPSPFDPNLECGVSGDCAQFAWDAYDQAPNVTNVLPVSNDNFTKTVAISINATVIDNINISRVFANITYPNGTSEEHEMFDDDANNIFNVTLTQTSIDGKYNYTVTANDSSTHQNLNISDKIILNIGDVITPNVSIDRPNGNNSYAKNQNITLRINATDEINISVALANITLPNGTVLQRTLANTSNGPEYEFNFTNTSIGGLYNVLYIVNDTAGNLNDSLTDTFGVDDSLAPAVFNSTPGNTTNFAIGSSINITVNVTDAVQVDDVYVNVTLPDNTTEELNLSNTSDTYNVTFTSTSQRGRYNITFFANDTTNNINSSVFTTFTVGDVVAPSLILNLPEPNYNQTSNTIYLSANITDNQDTGPSCDLLINDLVNQTDNSSANGTVFNFTLTATQAFYNWSVNCTDNATNVNTSATRNFTIDTQGPSTDNITLTPNTESLLDPNVTINLSIGVSDNLVGVQNVTFQYRVLENLTFSNISGIAVEGIYNATWTPNTNGTYIYQVYSKDWLNNTNTSNQLNISVQTDRTWTRTPTTIPTKSAALLESFLLSNITINNTGDVALNFTLGSTRSQTAFNESFPFQIAANTTSIIEVNETAPNDVGLVSFTIDVNASPDANPTTQTVAASFVVANDAFLTTNFINNPTVLVTQKDTGITYDVQVKNVGVANATNISLNITLPDWNTTSNLTPFIGDLAPNESETHAITIDIPDNATIGIQKIIANATGLNESGTILENKSFVSGEDLAVTVNSFVAIVSSSGGSSATTVTTTTTSTATASGGGSVGRVSSGSSVTIAQEIVRILRGTSQEIPITVQNTYANATLNNVQLDLQGFIASQVTVSPDRINKIPSLESRNFTLDILVPSYFKEAEYELTVNITGDLIPINATLAGFSSKEISFIRHFILKVESVDVTEIDIAIAEFQNQLDQMTDFNTAKLQALLEKAQEALDNNLNAEAESILNQLDREIKDAFAAQELITIVRTGIVQAQEKWLDARQTSDALQLALVAFERGDFATALERAKAAQLTLVLETKGRINIAWFILTYWWAVILTGIFAFFIGFLAYEKSVLFIIDRRLKNLHKEEKTLHDLMKETQINYLRNKSLSENQYTRYMQQYVKRRNKIKQIRIKLRNKRVAIIRTAQLLQNLQKEKAEITEMLKHNQHEYFIKGGVSRETFLNAYNNNKETLAQIEKEETVLREKLNKQKETKKYWFIVQINKLFTTLDKVIAKIKPKKQKFKIHRKKSFTLRKKAYVMNRKAKWVELAVPEHMKAALHCEKANVYINTKNYKKQSRKVSNKVKGVRRYTLEELKKWFPGAFT
jgi:uncharacterized membrane protein